MVACFSCGKEEEEDLAGILTSQTWELSTLTVSPITEFRGVRTTDIRSAMELCEIDDWYSFLKDGQLLRTDIDLFCEDSLGVTVQQWELNEQNRTITIGDFQEMEIDALNASIFRFFHEVYEADGQRYTFTYEYVEGE